MNHVHVCGLVLAATSLAAAELPVRQVILFKHGIGYFERSGELAAGEAARLEFKASEMDDVLKSLTVEDATGGKITGIHYDSSEPLAVKLQRFPFAIGERQPLCDILDRLKGERIELGLGGETVAGSIVSGRVLAATRDRAEEQQLTLLLENGELRTVNLLAAGSVRFSRAELQRQLGEYLSALSQSRSREKRALSIDSSGNRSRRIVAGYVVPMPVWKSSYRLILNDSAASVLEGWAIVDNTTEEDWNGVRLALVSGKPISFVSGLYEPRYVRRPVAEIAEARAAEPEVHEGAVGVVGGVPGGVAAGMIGGKLAPAPPPAQEAARRAETLEAVAAPAEYRRESARADVSSAVAATAEARELGELFEYSFAEPVTVGKGKSAMLPFLQQGIGARKLLIYADPSSAHPRNAVEITNATGKTLDGGPITVYDGNAYAGEALVETVKAGDKRLISYAVDLGTRITTKLDSRVEDVRELHFRQGVLLTRSARVETKTYTVRNTEQKSKTLVIEHPVRPQYKVANPKPVETTTSAYRFEIKLGPASTETLPVTEEFPLEQSFAVANLTPDVLFSYVRNKSLSESARKQLEQVAQSKRKIAELDGQINQRTQEINELSQDQGRLRQNIESLSRVSGQQEQVQAYARQLAQQETRLAAMRDDLAQLRKQRIALESELKSAIEKIEF